MLIFLTKNGRGKQRRQDDRQKNRLKNHVVYWFEDVRLHVFQRKSNTKMEGKARNMEQKQLIKIYYHCSMSSEAAKKSV